MGPRFRDRVSFVISGRRLVVLVPHNNDNPWSIVIDQQMGIIGFYESSSCLSDIYEINDLVKSWMSIYFL